MNRQVVGVVFFGVVAHMGKNTVFRDFPTFSRAWIFSLLKLSLFWSSLFFSSLTLPISAFHLSILSEVWLLNFLRPCTTLTLTFSSAMFSCKFDIHNESPIVYMQSIWRLYEIVAKVSRKFFEEWGKSERAFLPGIAQWPYNSIPLTKQEPVVRRDSVMLPIMK